MTGRILGIDYGRRRLGLALSDEGRVLASALPPLRRGRRIEQDLSAIAHLVRRRGVAEIVIGWPVQMDGSIGEMAAEVDAFAVALERATDRPVRRFDERLTSREADRVLHLGRVPARRRAALQDGIAATLILQGHLDRCRTDNDRERTD